MDLIERQAAIELIERMKPYHQDADDIAEMIANMPPAQADSKETSSTHKALDTISRRDAIEAIFNEPLCESGMKERTAIAVVLAIYEKIKSLPSAQPEIIACGDCIHWICHDRRCGYWNHGVKPLDWCCHAERRTDE